MACRIGPLLPTLKALLLEPEAPALQPRQHVARLVAGFEVSTLAAKADEGHSAACVAC